LGVLRFVNVCFECIWTTILYGYINQCIFTYIKMLCHIFTKYIMPILQVYPNDLIIIFKIITKDIYFHYYYILILITCNKKIHWNCKIIIVYYIMMMMMMMIIILES
jgi:hypothetical protein